LPAWALTAEIRHNIFLAFKEALHNVVKHARASEVRVSLELLPSGIALTIADNGSGFELNGFEATRSGHSTLKISAAAGGGPSMDERAGPSSDRLEAGTAYPTCANA